MSRVPNASIFFENENSNRSIDLLEDVRGKNNCLRLAQPLDQLARLVFLVGIQPIGRLVKN